MFDFQEVERARSRYTVAPETDQRSIVLIISRANI